MPKTQRSKLGAIAGGQPTRVDPWRRDPGAPFDDLGREQFAQERAKGHTLKVSSGVAGIAYRTAVEFERDERMKVRVRELRRGADNFVGVSVAWVLGELRKNVEGAREECAYKASNEALAMIYKIISEDKSVASSMARALPADVSRGDLQKMLRESFAQNARKAAGDELSGQTHKRGSVHDEHAIDTTIDTTEEETDEVA